MDKLILPQGVGDTIQERSHKYMNDIDQGIIPAGKLLLQAVRRQIDFTLNPPDGYEYDPRRGERVGTFLEALNHVKGMPIDPATGLMPTFDLTPHQAWKIDQVYSFVNEEGNRMFVRVYDELARKMGKSFLLAGLSLYHVAADGEGGAECYVIATNQDQANRLANVAKSMLLSNKNLMSAFGFKIFGGGNQSPVLKIPGATECIFKSLPRDHKGSLDGLNVSFAAIDEYHAHPDSESYDSLDTSTGMRSQPLIWIITTAGSDQTGPCYRRREYITKILSKEVENNQWFCSICTLDDPDEIHNPDMWVKANPNIGVTVSTHSIKIKVDEALQFPDKKIDVLTKIMNIWVSAPNQWIDLDEYDKGFQYFRENKITWDSFEKEDVVIGIDLSQTTDLTAVSRVFRRAGKYYVNMDFHLPQTTIDKSEKYRNWQAANHLTAHESSIIDLNEVQEQVLRYAEIYNIKYIAMDPFMGPQMMATFESHGFTVIKYAQGGGEQNRAINDLERAIKSESFIHDGNPILRWNFQNATIKYTADNSKKLVKHPHRENKDDGVVAAMMALTTWVNQLPEPETKPSIMWNARLQEYVEV